MAEGSEQRTYRIAPKTVELLDATRRALSELAGRPLSWPVVMQFIAGETADRLQHALTSSTDTNEIRRSLEKLIDEVQLRRC